METKKTLWQVISTTDSLYTSIWILVLIIASAIMAVLHGDDKYFWATGAFTLILILVIVKANKHKNEINNGTSS